MTAEPFRWCCRHGVDLWSQCRICASFTILHDEIWEREEALRLNSPTYRRALDNLAFEIEMRSVAWSKVVSEPSQDADSRNTIAPGIVLTPETTNLPPEHALDDLRHG